MTRKEYDLLKEGQEIWIKLAKKGYIKDGRTLNVKVIKDYIIPDYSVKQNLPDGYKKGWLHKGEPFSKKHHESVFYGRDEKNKKRF